MRKYVVLIVWMFIACSKPAGNIADETIIAPVDMDKCMDENGEALGFPVNQFLVFTNEPHPRADRMRQLAAEWGVELVGQIPDMGIWQLQCDCQTQAELEAFMEMAEQRAEVEFAVYNFLLDLQGSVQKSTAGGLCRAGGDLDELKNDFRLALESVNYYSTVILFDKIKEIISLSPVNILVMDTQLCLEYFQSQFADIASGLQIVGVNGEAAKQQDAQFCGQPGYGHGAKVLGILAADDDDGGVSGLLKRTLSTDFIIDIAPALAGKKPGISNEWGVHTMEFFNGLHIADLRSAEVVNITIASIWNIDHINKICDRREDVNKCVIDIKTKRINVRNKVQKLFEENEDILFVLAAGNHALQIDKLNSDPLLMELSYPQGIVSSKNNVIHVGAFDVPIKDTGVFGLWSDSNYSSGLVRGIAMKKLILLSLVVAFGFSSLLFGCFASTGARTGKTTVPYAQWSRGPEWNDWQKLAEFLQKNQVVINLHEYIAKQKWGDRTIPKGRNYYGPEMDNHLIAVDDYPIRLELELARKTTRMDYNELSLGSGWMLSPVESGKLGWGAKLLYQHFSVIQARWKYEGIHPRVQYRADSWQPDQREIPLWAEPDRFSSRVKRQEMYADYEICKWMWRDPSNPFSAIFQNVSIKDCFLQVFRPGLVPQLPDKDFRKWVELFFQKRVQQKIDHTINIKYILAFLHLYRLTPLEVASTLDDHQFVRQFADQELLDRFTGETEMALSYAREALVDEMFQTVLFGSHRSLAVILGHKIPLFHGIMHLAARQGNLSTMETLNSHASLANEKIQGDRFRSVRLEFFNDCRFCMDDYRDIHISEGKLCCEDPKRPKIQDALCKDGSVFSHCDQDLIYYRVQPQLRGIQNLRILLGSDEPYKKIDPVDFSTIEKNYEQVHVFYPYKTPLMFAAEYGRKEAVAFLLKHGADANAGNGGLSALSYAAKYDYLDIARMLLAAGALLAHEWVIEDEADVLKAFVGATDCDRNPVLFADSKNRIRTRWKYEQVHHPLFSATREGHLEMVKLLLSHMKDEKFDAIVKKSLDAIAGYRVFEYPQIRTALAAHLRRK